MPASLLSIVITAKSARGSAVVLEYPPAPHAIPRSTRPIYPYRAGPARVYPGLVHGSPDSSDDDRDSLSSSEGDEDDDPFTFGTGRSARKHEESETPEGSYLGFSNKVLATLLSPRRELCDQPFELVVNHLAFIGHPVWLGDSDVQLPPNAAPPAAATMADEADPRRGRDWGRARDTSGAHARAGSLPPIPASPPLPSSEWSSIPEQPPVKLPRSRSSGDTVLPTSAASGGSGAAVSATALVGADRLIAFNVVCCIDTPPDSHLSSHLEMYYRDVVIPLTASIKYLERTRAWLGREAMKLRRLKERSYEEGMAHVDFLRDLPSRSEFVASIAKMYDCIHQSTLCRLSLGSVPVQILLRDNKQDAFLSGGETVRNVANAGDARLFSRIQALEVEYEPWQTLLPIAEDPVELQREAPEGSLLWKFLDIWEPTISFAQFESFLDLDEDDKALRAIVSHLIHWRKGRIIDVVNMRSTYILCSDFDTTRLPELSSEFERAFPALLPLPALLARLTPSDSYVAAVADRHVGLRSSHLPALIWLLSRNVVNKQRIFIRVVASQEIKRRSQVHWGGSDFSSLAGKDDSRLSISSDAVDTAAALDIPASHSTSYSGGGGGFSSASGQQRRRMPSKPATFSTTSSRSRRASEDDGTRPSIIIEPGRPSVIERRWLAEMVRDKGPNMRDSFDKIIRMLNGLHATDEIRFRAGLTRKDLRAVLADFESYLVCLHHPG